MSSMFPVLYCVCITSRTFLRVRPKSVRVRQKYTVFGCNSSQYRSILAKETQCKLENSDDISFRTDASAILLPKVKKKRLISKSYQCNSHRKVFMKRLQLPDSYFHKRCNSSIRTFETFQNHVPRARS